MLMAGISEWENMKAEAYDSAAKDGGKKTSKEKEKKPPRPKKFQNIEEYYAHYQNLNTL